MPDFINMLKFLFLLLIAFTIIKVLWFIFNLYFLKFHSMNTVEQQPEVPSHRFLGVGLFIFQALIIAAYAVFGGEYFIQTSSKKNILQSMVKVLLTSLFTISGFGLLLSSYKKAIWLGMTTAFLTVAVSLQISPLMQKLWFSVFFTGFREEHDSEASPPIKTFWDPNLHYDKIQLSFVGLETAFISCIGILLIQTAVIGRSSLGQCFGLIAIYQIVWNLNYFLNIFLNYERAPQKTLIFDAYGASFLYLFSASFGLIYSLIMPQKISPHHPANQMDRVSLIFGIIGTGFIVALFAFTSNEYISFSGVNRSLNGLNMVFALTASIIGTFIGSSICGKGKVGYKEVLVGSVSGGVMIASVAPIEDNVGIIVFLGCLAGVISGVYMQTLHLIINKKYIFDSLGLFCPFLINALVGSFIVAPSVLDRYVIDDVKGNFNIQSQNRELHKDIVGFQLIYAATSLAFGIFGGLVAGMTTKCSKDQHAFLANSRFFVSDYSLYVQVVEESRDSDNSAKHFDVEN